MNLDSERRILEMETKSARHSRRRPDLRRPANKDKVLVRFVFDLGPQLSAAHLLSHLGDDAVFRPFAPGDEPKWTVVLAYLLHGNPHISIDEVVDAIQRKEM